MQMALTEALPGLLFLAATHSALAETSSAVTWVIPQGISASLNHLFMQAFAIAALNAIGIAWMLLPRSDIDDGDGSSISGSTDVVVPEGHAD